MAKTCISARWLLVGLVSLSLWVTPGASYSQSTELRDAVSRGTTLYDQGQYEEALTFHREAVKLGEQEFGAKSPTFATHLNNLAVLYITLGSYADAEPLFDRALRIAKKTLGPDHPEFAIMLENYADLLIATNRADEAEELDARAAVIRARQR